MEKIISHLWFDKEAREAAQFYVSVFGGDSEVTNTTVIHDTPSGDSDIVTFKLAGQHFMAISAGPLFKFTPSISFLVACNTKEEVEKLWNQLFDGGSALMELGSYPFSERYGWLNDKYGLSWQIMYTGEQEITQKITPTLMFVGDVCGKAEEAVNFYASVFDNAKVGEAMRYGANEAPDKEGTIRHVDFTLEGQGFAAMDSAQNHEFSFTEAISLLVHCENQEEIDHYWSKLSAVPESEQCGWLKDKYGVSWQIVPSRMDEMMRTADAEQLARVTKAFLQMKKFDLAELERAYNGR